MRVPCNVLKANVVKAKLGTYYQKVDTACKQASPLECYITWQRIDELHNVLDQLKQPSSFIDEQSDQECVISEI